MVTEAFLSMTGQRQRGPGTQVYKLTSFTAAPHAVTTRKGDTKMYSCDQPSRKDTVTGNEREGEQRERTREREREGMREALKEWEPKGGGKKTEGEKREEDEGGRRKRERER